MEAIAAQRKKTEQMPVAAVGTKQSKRISWEEFQRKYLSREDNYKYEWVGGEIVKTQRTMDYSQIFILKNLINLT